MSTLNKIYYLIKNPHQIKVDDNYIIDEYLNKFPYVQFIKILKLYYLYAHENENYCKSKNILLSGLNNNSFIEQKIENNSFIKEPITENNSFIEESITENIKNKDEFSSEDFINNLNFLGLSHLSNILEKKLENNDLKVELEEINHKIDNTISEIKDDFNSIKQEDKEIKNTKLDVNIKQSFNEWLMPNIILNKKNNSNNKKIESEFINDFIKKNPKISPIKLSLQDQIDTKNIDFKGKKIEKEQKNIQNLNNFFEHPVTETIANLYLEQAKYERAIKAYEILSLKNPKKSIYFAKLIQQAINLKNSK